MPSIRIGLAVYHQVDERGRTISPHWALIAHPTDFYASDVTVYQIVRSGTGWATRHKTNVFLPDAATLIGVIDLGHANLSIQNLSSLVLEVPPAKGGENPSALFLWDCAAWTIKVLHGLHGKGYYYLACPAQHVYSRVLERVGTLRAMRANATMPIVPF